VSNLHKFPFLEFSPFSGEAAPLLPPELVRKGYDTISGGAGENEMCDFANYLAQFFARYFGVRFVQGAPVWLRPGPRTCRERSEFLRLEISNFNTRSNLIALAEYRGSQLKPDYHSPADGAGRFHTTRWSAVLLSAQIATEGRLGP
jgi:hypothetical protein